MMIKNQLCKIAEMKMGTFDVHRSNKNLPFEVSLHQASDTEGRTWARFDLYHAMLLIAAQNLAAGQGVSWSEAASILREIPTHLGSEFEGRRANFRDPGFYCARIQFRCESGHEPSLIRQYHVVRGSLVDIAAYAERVVVSHNDRQHFPHDRIAVFSIAAVSLSQAWYIAEERAKALQIDFDADWSDGLPVGMADHE